tara:strand:- start:578 stop:1999 length:1422 start_codon:yes stop_codon:yes gene_type:complete
MITLIIDIYKRVKYFIYFNLFIASVLSCYIHYKITHKINYKLINILYSTIHLNGCILIKFIQWINTNVELLDFNDNNTIYDLFSNFYENCKIHDLNYTKQVFLNEFNTNFDNIIELDDTFQIKSGSIAQVYKGTYNNNVVAIKVVHPDTYYHMIFPVMYIKLYNFITNNISYLSNYRCPFILDNFFNNLSKQTDMINEFDNMVYFYNNYLNNPYILIPEPIYATDNILIMEFINGDTLTSINLNAYEKQKVVKLLNLFIKDHFFFKDYYHSDLHEANWKIIKYNDFYKIVIYDYGYTPENNYNDLFQKFVYYNDTNDLDKMVKIIYPYCYNINSESEFLCKYNEYIKNKYNNDNEHIQEYFTDEIIRVVYNFIYANNISVHPAIVEVLISLILIKKYIIKYLNVDRNNSLSFSANDILSGYISAIYTCNKYNIFPELKKYINETYINNSEFNNFYIFKNNFYDNLQINNNIDI